MPARNPNAARVRLQHHGALEFVDIGIVVECVFDGGVGLGGLCGQFEELFGAAIAVFPVVVDDALAHRSGGDPLLIRADRGVDIEPRGVDVLLEQLVGHHPRHFGDVRRLGAHVVAGRGVAKGLLEGRLVLGVGQRADLVHALQDVVLALGRPLRVDERIEQRGCLGQASQHRGFGRAELVQGLAEVDLGGRGESVCPLAQEDLVHVDLEDLILRQVLFDAQRQQRLVDLAGVGFFARQVEVLGQLLGDRAGALIAPARHEVGQRRPGNALEVDAAVFEKARVLGRQHGVLHQRGDVGDAHDAAPFLAELADQLAVGRIDAQRHLGPVVGQRVQRRQPVVGQQHGDRHGQQAGDRQADGHTNQQHRGARPQRRLGVSRRALFGGGFARHGGPCGGKEEAAWLGDRIIRGAGARRRRVRRPVGFLRSFAQIDRANPRTVRQKSQDAGWSPAHDGRVSRHVSGQTKVFTVGKHGC